jgi:hypothetical protein
VSDEGYTPCARRIVFAIDYSQNIPLKIYQVSKFLIGFLMSVETPACTTYLITFFRRSKNSLPGKYLLQTGIIWKE